ncbi:DUF5362 family protein [Marinifilum sp.]|uniref:DUF5362 family protein n=1 Tax=Marinifilum sp. TaxID=2033137 RepID=UPI003BA8C916
MQEQEGREAKSIEFTAESVIYLNETRKWTIFLSILGFIFLGLLVVASLFMSTIYNLIVPGEMPFPGMGAGVGIFYLLMGLLYFFPIYYLYKFSTYSKKAIYNEDKDQLSLAFRYLKSHYKFIGVFTIVMLSIYILIFLVALVVGGFAGIM